MDSATASLRVAASLFVIDGLGFGWFCLPAIASLRAGRGVPIAFGFPAYGHGVFERHGMPTTVPLLAGFLLVCLLEVLAGVLVWYGRVAGLVLGLALVPAGLVYWIGFSLPIPPVLAVTRSALLLAHLRRFS